MTQENVGIIHRLYRAMNTKGAEAFNELADPSLEWIPDRRVGEGPVHGREGVIHFFTDQAQMFKDPHLEIERCLDSGNQVLVFVRATGTGTSSGASFDICIAHLWTLSDGVVVRGEGYGNRAEALEAAGLSE